MDRTREPLDDPSSAPESGTVRDDTSGNSPSHRGLGTGPTTAADDSSRRSDNKEPADDPSVASEEP